MAQARICPYCSKPFLPSPVRPGQCVCSSLDCQRHRQTDYHRRKYRADAEYREICRDSDRKWRSQNPNYQRRYRERNADYASGNRDKQARRDRLRRMRALVKNNLAFDVKASSADVWLAGPELENLVKNNLAISQVMIFQTVAAPECP